MTWDYVQCRIRTKSISYSIKEARRARQHVNALSTKLKDSEEKVSVTPYPLLIDEITNIIKEIEDFYDQKARGALIRARCKFIEDSERPSKCFFKLRKIKAEKGPNKSPKHKCVIDCYFGIRQNVK